MKRHDSQASAVVVFVLLTCGSFAFADQHESASDLIHWLTNNSGMIAVDNPCGHMRADRNDAIALAALGDAALSEIERKLAVVASGHDSPHGLSWVGLAYARIEGRSAYNKLRMLERDSELGIDQRDGNDSVRRGLDRAISLSLGLTSFITAPAPPISNYRSCRIDANALTLSSGPCPPGTREEPPRRLPCLSGVLPRDALDSLIRAFERNDDFVFHAQLGPDAGKSFEQLLKKGTWIKLRAHVLQGVSSHRDLAMGYQFDGAGPWSDPPETLALTVSAEAKSAVLNTQFKSESGADCGTYPVQLLFSSTEGYLINNRDIHHLLNVFASCLNSN